MPTGYTSGIDDGTISDLKGYALVCARAFGALVDMRDLPLDAPMPTTISASSYHADALAKARTELQEFESLSVDQRRERFDAFVDADKASHDMQIAEYTATQAKYDAIAAEVRKWMPPTKDHEGLKSFMLEQLETGKPFEPRPLTYVPPDFELWCTDWRDTLLRQVEYHARQDVEERDRTAKRNQWLNDLRASLEERAKP